jgi:hypothetical protein
MTTLAELYLLPGFYGQARASVSQFPFLRDCSMYAGV